MTYITAFVTPVPDGNKQAHLASAEAAWRLYKEYGALQRIDGWGDDIPEGQLTDFRRAVALETGETVVLSLVLWPDKSTADACIASVETDQRWNALDMPFDGRRMIYGAFDTLFAAGDPAGTET